MLKLIKGTFALVHIPALREGAQRMLGWESEDLSFASSLPTISFLFCFCLEKLFNCSLSLFLLPHRVAMS